MPIVARAIAKEGKEGRMGQLELELGKPGAVVNGDR